MTDAQHVASLLLALTQPDTATIRQAELALKPVLKNPSSTQCLVEIVKGRDVNPNAVRHVAAIVLRKRLPSHYATFDPNSRTLLKQELLSILASEPERSVRHGMMGVVASVAKSDTEWPELWQFVAAAAGDAHADARELAFLLLEELVQVITEQLSQDYPHMASLFGKGLGDGSGKVQKAAVKALGQLLSMLCDEPDGVDAFAPLLPPLLQVATAHVEDEDFCTVVLDVLYDLSYSPSPQMALYLNSIVQFCLGCMTSQNLEMTVRDAAALVVATLAEAKPKTFGKETQLLEQVLDTLFGLIEASPDSAAGALFESNPAWRADLENDDDDAEWDAPTETSMAQGTLDMMACEIPTKYMFQPVVGRCMVRLSSPQANARKAGVACLGVAAEGLSEALREHLADVMPHVFKAAADPHSQVRECACFALGQLSEHCRPEILTFSSQILPIVFSLLDDTTVTVQATSCYVLEMFCERLEPEAVRPLLDPLVRKLASMLEATSKRSVQEMAVAALAATAVAAEEEFSPYVAGVAALMTKLMGLTEEHMFSLRGRALECMGHIAIAVGRDTFRPYFASTMQCALEGLSMDSTDLHEFAYAVFANLSKVMGEEFAPILPELVPHLVLVIGADEGQLEAVRDAEEGGGQFNALDDSDDEEGGQGNYVLHVRTAMLEAKKGAITAVGEMGAHTGAAFVPFLEDVVQVLQKAAQNWHPLIKCEVAEALPSMVVPSVAAYHQGEIQWKKGDVSGANPMSPHTIAIVSAVLSELITLMEDEDKDTVGKACEGVQSVIELCGPHALVPVAQSCLEKTHNLLVKVAPCHRADELYGDDPDDDDDHDSFMTSVCDLVGSFARVMGSHFAQYLPQFLPAICEYAKSSRPASDRGMAVGCLSELAQELEGSMSSYWDSVFFPACIAGLADPDDNVKRNAVFCAGICCENLKDAVVAQYPQLLAAISPLFSIDISVGENSSGCVDNAAAAVCRMIMASPTSVPMGQVLPALLKVLPLKVDLSENETVYTCLLGLHSMNNPDLAANKDEFRRVLTEATAEESSVSDEIKAKLRQTIPSL